MAPPTIANKLFRRNNTRRPSLPSAAGSNGPPRRNSLPFLPRRSRRKALTPPFLDIPPARQPKLLDQENCTFLFNLPYELREQIYLEVLGEGPIRFEEIDERTGVRKKAVKRRDKWREETGAVAMMQTCRFAYIEVHPLLYQTHTIRIPSVMAFRHLTSSILPPAHLPLLTSLHFNIYFPYILFPYRKMPPSNSYAAKMVKQLQHFDLPNWTWTWDVLGDLCRHGSLTELTVRCTARDYTNFHPDWPKRPEENVNQLLWAPVVKLADDGGAEQLRVWDIAVTWPVDEDGKGGPADIERKDWPFTLTTVQGDVAAREGDDIVVEEQGDGDLADLNGNAVPQRAPYRQIPFASSNSYAFVGNR